MGDMNMVTREKQVTAHEFEKFIARSENADRLFELINGEIVEKVPTQKHGVIAVNISTELKLYSRSQGGVVAVEVRHRMPDDAHNAYLPDVAYYADDSKPLVDTGPVPYMPDVAVEIQSPSDSLTQLRAKARYYLAHGTSLVWIIVTEKRLVEVYTADFEDILTDDDVIEGGAVLPGFQVAVKDILPPKS